MHRLAVVRTPAAEDDLIDIWCSIALDSPRAADRMLDNIAGRIGQQSEFPDLGSARPDIAADARALTEGNYLILYRHDGRTVEIVRILHGARDLTALI